MKKIIAFLMCIFVLIGAMTGCGTNPTTNTTQNGISIVATIFPIYDWVSQITQGTNAANIDLLLDTGVDLHSYQPSADDIIQISTCDLFIYVGGESDAWVNDALKEATNKNMRVISLLDVLGDHAKEEELVDGMQNSDDEPEDEPGEEIEYDEHVWLSLNNAKLFCNEIAKVLSEIDSQNADAYKANSNTYCDKLSALDKKYNDVVSGGTKKALLFADRFPFRYLVDDYKLDYFAAFSGCSAETEASFETILFLANKVDALGLQAIMQIESADGRVAQTVKQATKTKDQTVLTLNSMQSTTMNDIRQGANYLSIMEDNMAVLKEALK